MDNQVKNSILIVDDEKSNLLVLNSILNQDYTLYVARNGVEAVKRANECMPDLILLDILMPGMDGYAVISALKNSDKTQNIPVIFITGLSDTSDEEKGLSLGAVDYIGKPFSPAIVKLRVQSQIKIINQTRLIIENEIAIKSSRARSEFLSRMSHEMRTPMNAIMGMASLAKNAVETDKLDEMLGKITDASGHLMKLIDDILDMSDIEDNTLCLSCSEFSFAVMISGILNKAGMDIQAKQQSLTTGIDPSIPDMLIGDERRLSQVILNLLSNATKFTQEQGSIQINAFVRGVENETLTMQVEVIDNGMGMPKEQQEKLFLPFEQADGGIDRKFGGAGLGLTISKYIVELMGGEIWVESELGKGSKVSFTVNMQLKALETKDAGPVSLERKMVLVVDDVEINREIVIAMLEGTGLQIECAVDGSNALELFSADPGKYDIIFMDINMPVMDGLEATRRIRSLSVPESTRIPIIAMTANVLMSEVETYLAAGMTDHIGKPLDYDKLLDKLNRYLQ